MTHLVFVYGSLLSGLGNHPVLTDHGSRKRGNARTAPRYTMLSLGAYPGVTPFGTDAIVGEVYQVSDRGLAALDRLEGHPRFYRRQMHDVTYGNGRTVRAWIYLLGKDYLEGNEQIAPDWRAYMDARDAECDGCGDPATTTCGGYNLCESCAAVLREAS